MAATLQQQPQTQHANPQLKRLVYSKYREMLGNYNDKANAIIEALPAYMVTEDKGFHFDLVEDHQANGKDVVDFSVPLPPTLPTNGSLPSRRLQTQAPPSEPPACVQNAMMTKDKKPFTYTPGGIDLSQIKSPRMAKRIARNAQQEGITNQPRPSPLAQDNTYPGPPPPASAMGLPVQVFPSGPPPPPPPPAPPSSNSVGVPPPPPPMSLSSSNQLTAQTNGRDARKSPTPQNFEPPPLGMRPEIKIPPNPMATLRKVPKPEPKNDFWVEEYRRDNSKSPLPGEGDTSDKQQEQQYANQNHHQENPRVPSPPKPDNFNRAEPEADKISPRKEFNRVNFQQPRPQSQQLPASRPIQPTLPQQSAAPYQQNQAYPQQTPYSQQQVPIQQQQQVDYPPHMDPNRIAFQQQRWGQPQPGAARPSSPPKQQSQYPGPPQPPSGQYQQPKQHQGYVMPNMQHVDSPFQTQQDQSNFQRPFSPISAANKPTTQPNYYAQRQQQPQQQQPQPSRQNVTSPTSQQKPTQIGSLYIAPVAPENLAFNGNEQQRQQGLPQTPSWLSQRPNMKEDPDWIREVNTPPATNRIQSPPVGNVQNNAGSGPGLKLQMNIAPTSSNTKERIIPIQLEKTPTPTRTPNTPAFGPQPYSSGNQQYGSVASPTSGYSSPTVNIIRNPNHFVDQGYNNFSNSNQCQWSQQPDRVVSPPNQSGGTRIIPIAVERDDGPFGSNATRGPISPSPMVIQNGSYRLVIYDCPLDAQLRYGKGRLSDPRQQQQQSRTNGTPTTPNQSKSFRVLQRITDTNATGRDSDNEQPAELQRPQYSRQMGAVNDSTEQMRRMQINDSPDNTQMNWGPIQRQTQKYVQQKPIYAQDEQPQQYIHPSEQQVHEPKIYTGSAIPSRSFKLLQAMTTPENAVEMDYSSVENEQFSPHCAYPYPNPSANSFPSYDYNVGQGQDTFYQPYYYYYPQYDEYGYGDYGNGFDDNVESVAGTPNIIITGSPDEEEANSKVVECVTVENNGWETPKEMEAKFEEANSIESKTEAKLEEPKAEEKKVESKGESALEQLTKRLSQILSDDIELDFSKFSAEATENKEQETESKLVTFNNGSSNTHDESEDESDDLLTSSSSSEEYMNRRNSKGSRDSLHAGKSVTNIKVYDKEEEKHLAYEKTVNCPNNDNAYSSESDEEVEEEHQEGIVDMNSDTEQEEELSEYEEDVEIRDQLSVILEEEATESAEKLSKRRTESMNSTSSTISDCSTTIANDNDSDDEEEQNITDQDEGDEEEENSVTVRLPLKLSFSRSSNDENITTVVVGDSEIKDERRIRLSRTDAMEDNDRDDKDDEEASENDDDDGHDVSVTFSIPSRSNSIDRSGLLSKTPSADHETSSKDWEDSDSEVSISVSLPMKRNKFMTKTLSDGVTNNIHDSKPGWWENEDSEEEEEEIEEEEEHRTEEGTLVECIPETIDEEEEAEEEVEEESSEETEEEEEVAIADKKGKDEEREPLVLITKSIDGNSTDVSVNIRPSETPEQANEILDIFGSSEELPVWSERLSKWNLRDAMSKIENNVKEQRKVVDYRQVNSVLENANSRMLPSELGQLPMKFNPLQESLSFTLEETQRICEQAFSAINNRQQHKESKISVRERIAAFETPKETFERSKTPKPIVEITSNNTVSKKEILSRNSSVHRSESEDDSGVTSDMSKPVSETDTDPECFPELKKMTRYQRASTHSRLFRLLQDETSFDEDSKPASEAPEQRPEVVLRPKKKIVHNVSILRRSNPEALKEAETMCQRRERLSLPLKMSNSIDADNLSTSNSPSSPTNSSAVNDKLVTELIQSLLLKNDSSHLRNLPWDKLQAAAKKVLQEELEIDSLQNTSVESTPALTPQENKGEYQKSYADYYETWNRTASPRTISLSADANSIDTLPAKILRNLQNDSPSPTSPGQKKYGKVRCPRVLNSKTLSRDLSRVTEGRESESPDLFRRRSTTPERSREFFRGASMSRLERV